MSPPADLECCPGASLRALSGSLTMADSLSAAAPGAMNGSWRRLWAVPIVDNARISESVAALPSTQHPHTDTLMSPFARAAGTHRRLCELHSRWSDEG